MIFTLMSCVTQVLIFGMKIKIKQDPFSSFLTHFTARLCLWHDSDLRKSDPSTNSGLFHHLWMWVRAASKLLHHVFEQQQLHEAAWAQRRGGPAQSWTFTNAGGCFKQHGTTVHFLLAALCFKGQQASLSPRTWQAQCSPFKRVHPKNDELQNCCMHMLHVNSTGAKNTVEMDFAKRFYDVTYFFSL